MEKEKLSNLTIVLKEIEHPKKGRGCAVTFEGNANSKSLAKMLVSMFMALEKKYPLALVTAFTIFFDVDHEDLED